MAAVEVAEAVVENKVEPDPMAAAEVAAATKGQALQAEMAMS